MEKLLIKLEEELKGVQRTDKDLLIWILWHKRQEAVDQIKRMELARQDTDDVGSGSVDSPLEVCSYYISTVQLCGL
jgi:hypothetical protein